MCEWGQSHPHHRTGTVVSTSSTTKKKNNNTTSSSTIAKACCNCAFGFLPLGYLYWWRWGIDLLSQRTRCFGCTLLARCSWWINYIDSLSLSLSHLSFAFMMQMWVRLCGTTSAVFFCSFLLQPHPHHR
jgi:hypothetical protein